MVVWVHIACVYIHAGKIYPYKFLNPPTLPIPESRTVFFCFFLSVPAMLTDWVKTSSCALRVRLSSWVNSE